MLAFDFGFGWARKDPATSATMHEPYLSPFPPPKTSIAVLLHVPLGLDQVDQAQEQPDRSIARHRVQSVQRMNPLFVAENSPMGGWRVFYLQPTSMGPTAATPSPLSCDATRDLSVRRLGSRLREVPP
jgi:hypothetical protein